MVKSLRKTLRGYLFSTKPLSNSTPILLFRILPDLAMGVFDTLLNIIFVVFVIYERNVIQSGFRSRWVK